MNCEAYGPFIPGVSQSLPQHVRRHPIFKSRKMKNMMNGRPQRHGIREGIGQQSKSACVTKTQRMKTDITENISLLNSLIETCKDGEKGYTASAEDAKDPELQAIFRRYAQQRAEFARELSAAVRAHGGDPDKTGSVSGAVHRGWIDLKAALSTRQPHAVLVEAERGEDVAVSNYRNVSEQLYDPPLRDLVSRQFSGVKAAHDHIRELRDSPRYATKS